jgi:Icc-related predicted phosphoesterase
MIRLGAIADIHARSGREHELQAMFAYAEAHADILVIAGDLTDTGQEDDARVLGHILDTVSIPVVGVLGNHDFNRNREAGIRRILEEHGMKILDGHGWTFEHGGVRLGIAGAPGFGGGFRPYNVVPFGEVGWKDFYEKIMEETAKFDRALLDVHEADYVIGVTHYSPCIETMGHEPEQLYMFLGSSELGDALERHRAFLGIHGHAHRGQFEGHTPNGIPVFNVAMPIIGRPLIWKLSHRERSPRPDSMLVGAGSAAD